MSAATAHHDGTSLLARVMVLLLLLLLATACADAPPGNTSLHLQSAEWLTVPGQRSGAQQASRAGALVPQTGWASVALPHAIPRGIRPTGQDLYSQAVTTDWYRLDLSRLATSSELNYLYLPRWKTIGQLAVYGDGQLIYQSEGSWLNNGFNHPLWLRLSGAVDARPFATVVLRIDRAAGSGSALSTVWAGPARSLAWRYQIRQLLQVQLPYLGGFAFLVIGLFSLAVWLFRQRETIYLLFFAICTAAFIRLLHYHTGGANLPIPDDWFGWMSVASLMWVIVFIHLFLERLHQRKERWLTPVALATTLAVNIATMPGALKAMPGIVMATPLLYLLLLVLTIVLTLKAFRNALRSRTPEVWLMGGWFVITVASSIYDLALQNNQVSPEGVYTNGYGIMGLLVMLAYIMLKRYVGAMQAGEQANINLAQSLEKREAELAISYEKLRVVEQQQLLSHERQRLMQDMHDGLGSSLISAIRSVEHGGMSDTQVSQILKDCMDDLKLAIDSMEPVEADLLLLLATLRFRLEPRLEGTGITLLWQVHELPSLNWLEPSSALHILRIVQEAFANILKHTRATEICVSTGVEGDGVTVTISDNGKGFDVDTALHNGGKGLANQLRRAQFLGGEVRWQSTRQGASMTLWLPKKRMQNS